MSSSAVPGMAGIQALGSYVEEIANSSWLATVSASDLAYESSEASIAASIMPEILSLGKYSSLLVKLFSKSLEKHTNLECSRTGNAEFTILLSKQAVVASSLAEAESSLSSKVFTTITTAFGTETAVVTEPILVPIVTHQKAKLTPGQKIGLGIGIPAFILLALGIGFVVFHVRRNRVRSQEAAFMEVQPEEKKLKHVDPQPEGSAVGLRSSGASFGHDNTAASTLAGDRPRPQSYNGATYEDSVENRRVQSFHGVPSCRNSTGRPLDIADSTYGDDLQASRAFDAFWHAYDGGHPSPEAEMNAQPTDNLHAMLPIAHELPATPLNTRLHSPVSHQSTREGISTGSEVNGAGVHTGMDTESEASMENWREAIAERENAYDGDNDEAEHSEGIGRAN